MARLRTRCSLFDLLPLLPVPSESSRASFLLQERVPSGVPWLSFRRQPEMDGRANGSRDFPERSSDKHRLYGYPINPTDIFATAFSPRTRRFADADKARRLAEVPAPRFVRPGITGIVPSSRRGPGKETTYDAGLATPPYNGGRRFGFRFGFPPENGRRKERACFVTSSSSSSSSSDVTSCRFSSSHADAAGSRFVGRRAC